MASLRPLLRLSSHNHRILAVETIRFARILRHTSSTMPCFNATNPNTSQKAQSWCTYRYIHEDKTKMDSKVSKEESQGDKGVPGENLTQVQRMRKLFAEYGSTAVAFHICISLTSLGICYSAVKSGLDVPLILQKIGINKGTDSAVTTGASTFVIAYACHKVFAPLRMFLTITCTPLIVRRLRIMGILKEPLKQNP